MNRIKTTVVTIAAVGFVCCIAQQVKSDSAQSSTVLVTKRPTSPSHKAASVGKSPKPLKKSIRKKKIAQIRSIVRVSKGKTPTLPDPPAEVVLTAGNSRVGRSYMSVSDGSTVFSPSNLDGALAIKLNDENSYITLNFATQPGRTYMLDCFVSRTPVSRTSWKLRGGITGQLTPNATDTNGGHLIAGFVANRSVTQIEIKVSGHAIGTRKLYSAHLTRLD